MAHPSILAFVLAGGQGSRLSPLTSLRSKPSVPFGGRYRIVDFVLSNLLNSRISSIYLLVQYKSQSLIEHVRRNWAFSSLLPDNFVTVVPPQMRMGPEWFQGTADAVSQNWNLIADHRAELVLVFGADHVYRMDIRQMVDFHLEKDALVTVAARPVPLELASAFGIIATDADRRIVSFQEKPKQPVPLAHDPTRAYVSMGNYIFSRDVLLDALAQSQEREQHDFGAHLIPSLLDTKRVFAYDFNTNIVPGTKPHEEQGYWRDIGTIPAYFEAHMETLGARPTFDLHNGLWPVHPAGYNGPAARILGGEIRDSSISEGVVIHGARIGNSILRRDVTVEEDVTIEECIIMDHVVLKKGCRLRRAIVDKFNVVPEGDRIGFGPGQDRTSCPCHRDPHGVTVVPKAERAPEQLR